MSDEVKVDEVKTEVKTFSQEDLNSFIGKTKKETQEKLLKELGVENVENVKDALKQLREKQDLEKTETQKLKEQIELLTKEKQEVLTKAELSESKVIAIAKGVNSEKVDKFIKVAQSYDGENMQEKINAALIDFPEFLTTKAPANIGGQTAKQDVSDDEQMKADMRKAMGLK